LIRRRLLATAVYATIGVVLVWSLWVIAVTGPVVIRSPPALELPYSLEISADRLRRDVESLCEDFGPRNSEHPENLQRAAGWIAGELRQSGLPVEMQEYELARGVFRNVVAFRQGLDPDAPVRIIGAHYDTYDDGPGADDNASGVAVLLELVRTLPPAPPRRSQYFVAFGTRKPPGSDRFARTLLEERIGVDMMLSLDTVGYFTDASGSQRYPWPGLGLVYPDRGNFIAVVGDLRSGQQLKRVRLAFKSLTDLPIYSFRGPSLFPGVMESDQRSFRELGMPGVLITDSASMRYDGYHTAQDTAPRLDYERMVEVVRGLHAIVLDRDVSH
jgi:hypothetical protein